jgi:hypothetical protein
MTKDKALDLALEALEKSVATCFDRCAHEQVMSRPEHFINQAITAIKQARALDKKAENARELGLDYEPADGTQVSKVWWDGEKLMAKPIPLEDIYQPAPVQEPDHGDELTIAYMSGVQRGKELAAKRPWVGLTDEEMYLNCPNWLSQEQCKVWVAQIEAKLKEKST